MTYLTRPSFSPLRGEWDHLLRSFHLFSNRDLLLDTTNYRLCEFYNDSLIPVSSKDITQYYLNHEITYTERDNRLILHHGGYPNDGCIQFIHCFSNDVENIILPVGEITFLLDKQLLYVGDGKTPGGVILG